MGTSLILAITLLAIIATKGGIAGYGDPGGKLDGGGWWQPNTPSPEPPRRDHYPYIRPAQLKSGDNCWSACGEKGGKCNACPAVENLLWDVPYVIPGKCCRRNWDDGDDCGFSRGCNWYHCCITGEFLFNSYS